MLRLERFRRLSRHLPRPVRRHPRISVTVVAIAVAVALAFGVAFWPLGAVSGPSSAGRGPASGATSGVPSFTYSGTWSLLDLQRHIGAGEVVAVTAAPAGANTSAADPSGDQVLVAKTTDGQLIRIALNVSAADAASALSRMGYGGLLTAEAWKAIQTGVRSDVGSTGASSTSPTASSGGPADGLRSLLTLLVPVLLVTLLMVFLMRMVSRVSPAARDSATQFRTIMPASKEATTAADSAGAPVTSSGAMPPVLLADVAGCDEAKLELTETIEFLKSPERFHRLGARIPRGIMLWGPPGTGKTMLARAVPSEAGVPFHYTSGSEFVEKYVGVGARRVRELFPHARKLGRGVIFFDEFDALGKARGGLNSHEEREQTLNQLLVELDGFTTTDDIVVIAATNRVDVLDSAALRPGRFGRKIHVGLPDVVGRRELLEVHARNKPLSVSTDLAAMARKTYGFLGAQLADVLNEAAILAARRSSDAINPEDLHAGWLKVAVGTARRRSMDERERSIIAAHEVGHAICGKVHGDRRKVEEISLFAHGEALGVTVSSQEDNDLPAESDLRARLVALMGGRAAEELLFQEVTGGAANDFEQANRIATSMVTRWGMGRDPESNEHGTSGRGSLSFLVARNGGTLPSDVQAAATRATRAILDEAYAEACRTLLEHMDLLRRLAAYLVEHERVDGDTFDALVDGTIEVPNALDEWRPAAARPRAWADIPTWHAGRGKPVVLPVPVVAALPAPIEPAREPLPVPVTLPIPIREARRRLPGERRRTVAGQLSRRLRRLAVGYVDGAKQWFWSGEGDPEA